MDLFGFIVVLVFTVLTMTIISGIAICYIVIDELVRRKKR